MSAHDDGPMLDPVEGGVCAVPGITAAGVASGIKGHGALDLALVDAGAVVAAAGVQTTNQVKAAPVRLTARHLGDGRARAVVLNSGGANACTGPDGDALALDTAIAVADRLGCEPSEVLVCSTGVIGVLTPREELLSGVPAVVGARREDGGTEAARAIMTTDTVPKEAAVRVWDEAGACVIGGMAKGAGMIAPELATLLAVITTDAPLRGPVLQAALRQAAARTFGRISVDDCRSTNDAVLLLATGTAEPPPSLAAFTAGLLEVCAKLAEALVRDAEGAAHLLRVRVTGARSEDDAVGVARSIAGSVLVRTALGGADPNWGRVLAAMGAGAVRFDPDRVAVSFGGMTVCRFGSATTFDRGRVATALRADDVECRVDLGVGSATATVLTSDLSHAYVSINAEYTT